MFTRMDQSTKEDWEHISQEHMPHILDMPNRDVKMMEDLMYIKGGFAVHQLEHCLQTATLARRDGADDEMILLCLIHDIGKVISVLGHGEIAAEIVKPYVSEDTYNILKYHQDFQGKHYYHYQGKSTSLRDKYKNESWYNKCVKFTDDYDQVAFDPMYESDTLESFIGLIEQTFKLPKVQ